VAEGMVLSLAGALAGVLVAAVATRLIVSLVFPAATAILDRFLAHAVLVQMIGKSYRLRQRTGTADD
jgi:predicted membrane protein